MDQLSLAAPPRPARRSPSPSSMQEGSPRPNKIQSRPQSRKTSTTSLNSHVSNAIAATPDDDILYIRRSNPGTPRHERRRSEGWETKSARKGHVRTDTLSSDASKYSAQEDRAASASSRASPPSTSPSFTSLPQIQISPKLDLESYSMASLGISIPAQAVHQPNSMLPSAVSSYSDTDDAETSLLNAYYNTTAAGTPIEDQRDKFDDLLVQTDRTLSSEPSLSDLSDFPAPPASVISNASEVVEDGAENRPSHFREAPLISPAPVLEREDPYHADVEPETDSRDVDIYKEIDEAIQRSRQNSLAESELARAQEEIDRSIEDEQVSPERSLEEPPLSTYEVQGKADNYLTTSEGTPTLHDSAPISPGRSSPLPPDLFGSPRSQTSPTTTPRPDQPERRFSSLLAREDSRPQLLSSPIKQKVQLDLSLCRPNRPLPSCLECKSVLALRSSGDRALAYARKIQQIQKEESGLSVWLAWTKEQQSHSSQSKLHLSQSPNSRVHQRSRTISNSSSFRPLGHTRYEPSIEFPIRQSEAVKATDITQKQAAPTSFMPSNLPYPGALPHRSSITSISSLTSTQSALGSSSSSSKPGFLANMGRKASSKNKMSSKAISSPLPFGSVEENEIYAPKKQTSTPVSALGRTIMPQGPRSSDSIPISPSGRQELFNVKPEDVQRMAECLPQANRTDLERHLALAQNDTMQAITSYLQEHK